MHRSVILVLTLTSAWIFGACSILVSKTLDDKSADGGGIADLRVDGPNPGDRGPGEGIVPPNDAGPGENVPPPNDVMPDMPPPPPSFCPTTPISVSYSNNLLFDSLSLSADSQGVIGLGYVTGTAMPGIFDGEMFYGFFESGASKLTPWTADVSGWTSATAELFTMATAQTGPPDRVHFFATKRSSLGSSVDLHHFRGDPGGNPANITGDDIIMRSTQTLPAPIEFAAAAGPDDVVYLVTIEQTPGGGTPTTQLSIWVVTPKNGGGYDYQRCHVYSSAGPSPSFPSIALSPDGTQVAVSFMDASATVARLIRGPVDAMKRCPSDVSEEVTTLGPAAMARFSLTVFDGGEVDLAGVDSSGDLKAWRCLFQQACTESIIAPATTAFFADAVNLLRKPGAHGVPNTTDPPPVIVTYAAQPPTGSPELHVAFPSGVVDTNTGELKWSPRGTFLIPGTPGQIATTLWSGDTSQGPGDAIHIAFEDLSTSGSPHIQYFCAKLP